MQGNTQHKYKTLTTRRGERGRERERDRDEEDGDRRAGKTETERERGLVIGGQAEEFKAQDDKDILRNPSEFHGHHQNI